MPRTAINLEPYKAQIIDLYTENIPRTRPLDYRSFCQPRPHELPPISLVYEKVHCKRYRCIHNPFQSYDGPTISTGA